MVLSIIVALPTSIAITAAAPHALTIIGAADLSAVLRGISVALQDV